MEKFLLVALRKAIPLLLFVCACAARHQVQACDGFYTSPTGSFSSPLYPSQYPPYQDCVYIINATDGHRITLTFLHFQLEAGTSGCNYDYLQIRDGNSVRSSSMGIFCNTTIPGRMRSTSNTMWIRFRSDSSVSGTGFEATYTTTSNGTTTTSDKPATPSDETTATNYQSIGTSVSTRATSNRTTTSEYVKTKFYSTTANSTTASETPQHYYVTWKSDSKEHLYINTTNMIIIVACAAAAALTSGVIVVAVVALRRIRRKPAYERSCEKHVTITGRTRGPDIAATGKAVNLRVDYLALVLHRDYGDKKQNTFDFRPNCEEQDPDLYLHEE